MSQRPDIIALLRQGIEEARDGNRQEARRLFEQVVKQDPKNEKGWMWLASVSDDERQQREALETVLMLNPNNERAKTALSRLSAAQTVSEPDEVIPGVSRRTLMIVVGGGLVIVVVLILGFVLMNTLNANRINAERTATQVAQAATNQAGTEIVVAGTATAAAQVTPSPTPVTPTRTPIPTWTPTMTEPPAAAPPTSLPTPAGLTGLLAGWSGRDLQSIDYLPVGVYDLASGAFRALGNGVGRDVDIHPAGFELIYTRYDQRLFDSYLDTVNVNSSVTEPLSSRVASVQGMLSAEMPRYSGDGRRVVFVAITPETNTPQVYVLDLENPNPEGPNLPRRLTIDRATYSYPDLSPDGRRVAVVRNDLSGPNPGPDIIVIDVNTGSITPITSDLGAFIETSPHWSPDGRQIVYAAAPADNPRESDIAVRAADGSGVPTVVVRDEGNDIFPVFSPDGRYIAFSSNRSGQYDIYIYDQATQTTSQLTNTIEEDYAGGWWQVPTQ